jgi:hypothetical protein
MSSIRVILHPRVLRVQRFRTGRVSGNDRRRLSIRSKMRSAELSGKLRFCARLCQVVVPKAAHEMRHDMADKVGAHRGIRS